MDEKKLKEYDEIFDFIEKSQFDWERLVTDDQVKIKTNQNEVEFEFMTTILQKFNLRITTVSFTDYYGIVFGIEKRDRN
ncbi:MAG: hypothetical protein ACR2LL_13220 [Nitrosopumilus sp.]|uniref:hypothetical protein n=1 Tax=Nitrosopumilus sp. TaxID=2024843 RepID=UPI00292E23D0|nr:hypothetical protein [Nitrosopumilus sp.]